MLTAIMQLHAAAPRLAATNAALAGLRSLEVRYRSCSTMERRTPAFKQELIQRTEQLALGVTMAWVGTAVALNAEGEEISSTETKAKKKQKAEKK